MFIYIHIYNIFMYISRIHVLYVLHIRYTHAKFDDKTIQGNAARKISPINRSAGVAMINRG